MADAVCTSTDYGIRFTSAVQRENLYGVQFHPESILTPHGKQILQNFLEM